MRSIIKLFKGSLPLIIVSLCCGAAVVSVQGQSMRDVRIISARAGGVNFVSGEARVKLRGQDSWQTLTTKDTLASGDTVTTGAGSQVEVLLNPGAYLRLGENAEFTLVDDTLKSLRLNLTRGSGIIEATGFNELRISIVVDTPQTKVEIVRSGIYRINVQSPNSTEVAVQKGRALVGKEPPLTLKGGRTARISGVGIEVAKLNKKEKDALDLWSRERAKMLAKANAKLTTRNVNTLLASMYADDYWSPGYALTGGFWYYNLASMCYVFVPGGYGWSSPYGHHYSNNLYWPAGRICNGCGSWGRDYRDWANTNPGGGGGGGGGSNNGGGGGGGGSKATSTRDFPSHTSKQAPESRPAPAPVKSADKMNRDQ